MRILTLITVLSAMSLAAPAVATATTNKPEVKPAISAAQEIPKPDPLTSLLAIGTAFATTAALGAAKKYTNIADTAIGKAIRPIQPWLVMALSVGLPLLIHGTPNVPDPTLLATAPTATLLAVGAAEILRRFVPARPTLSGRPEYMSSSLR